MQLLTVRDVCAALKISRPTLYSNLRRRPGFPRPLYPASRSPRWRTDEIEDYLDRLSRERTVRAA